MVELVNKPKLGPFTQTRRLQPGVLGDRWLALDDRDNTSHVIHKLRSGSGVDREHSHRWIAALEHASDLDHPHILKIETYGLDPRGRAFAVTPYTGDSDGVLSLESLLRRKGGWMNLDEAKRAIEQLLTAVSYAHERGTGHAHGELSMAEVQVDRRGSLMIENYGLARSLGIGAQRTVEAERREVQSVLEIGYQLISGLRVEHPVIPASRVMVDLDPSWDDLFETGLGEPGFATAAHAMSAVQNCRVGAVPASGLGRVKTAIRKLFAQSV